MSASTLDPTVAGKWDLLDFNSEVLAVHAALLHTGKVLFFAGSGNSPTRAHDPDFGNVEKGDFVSVVWDVANGNSFSHPKTPISPITGKPADFFCCGQVCLPDGRVLAAGGTKQYDPFRGIQETFRFDPVTEQWSPAASMRDGRWYPMLVARGDGTTLVVSGLDSHGSVNNIPEFYSPVHNVWTSLPRSPAWPTYSHMFLLRSGKMFFSGGNMGGNDGLRPSIFDLNTGQAVDVPGLADPDLRDQSASVLLPPAADQRVMIMGGGSSDTAHGGPPLASQKVNIANLSAHQPVYESAPPMNFHRMHANAVLLPDRTVFVSGGGTMSEMATKATLDAEIFDPASNKWTVVAKASVPRLYHSVALLLPDGRVVTAGSNPMRGNHVDWRANDPNEVLKLEIYSPPYLFRGSRPKIDNAPAETTYGGTITIQTGQAATISSVCLMRPMATTHSSDSEQRVVDVPFTAPPGGNALHGSITAERNLAPPGWYMLFIVDRQRTPSVAAWIHLS